MLSQPLQNSDTFYRTEVAVDIHTHDAQNQAANLNLAVQQQKDADEKHDSSVEETDKVELESNLTEKRSKDEEQRRKRKKKNVDSATADNATTLPRKPGLGHVDLIA